MNTKSIAQIAALLVTGLTAQANATPNLQCVVDLNQKICNANIMNSLYSFPLKDGKCAADDGLVWVPAYLRIAKQTEYYGDMVYADCSDTDVLWFMSSL